MRIETERLIIRDPKKEDIESSVKLWMDPKVNEFMGPAQSESDVRQTLEEDLAKGEKQYGFWTVVEKGTNQFLGDVGLIEKDIDGKKEVEIVYFIMPGFWNKGFATEVAEELVDHAFEKLSLKRVVALVHPQNIASRTVAQRAGMSFEKDVKNGGGETRQLFAING